MSNFEIITLNFSFVLGLGIAQILNSIVSAIRDRNEHALDWVPLTWAVVLFVYHVQFLFALQALNAAIETWTWSWYALTMLLAVLLFVAGALVLPGRGSRATASLRDDFQTNGRLALLPLAAYFLLWIVPNAKMSGGLSSIALWNVSLVLFAVPAWFPQPRVRALATVASMLWPLALFTSGVYSGPDAGNPPTN